ncbi:NAD(P)-dependent dehydrogenase (short-subunit alcohol dehydrogenase family) [Herbihabitans rhizosphaerae]|uniref:NAD(P)-dependent dehydrogenase (Short-subunit alcohol dehydrogenase family) n=1 Tax=Herbihabitans rhizosphaerae TaxID=1872711 RepID=A0A4Q7KCU9_9PSEU|nr:SDR family oxidoreductase [Herbihabitans rhizosphaerae]RZS31358.1 NAD(P)-dependent dehydrogenase (short-subunit alcohol dehydrogenase family) [Herbihabitans rhizosphaerae]
MTMPTPAPRRVLVTGASGGIGRAVAAAFAAAGDRVAVHYVSKKDSAEETLAALSGDGHVLVSGDIGAPDAVAGFVAEAAAGLGGIDVLVNNAAVGTTADNAHRLGEVSYVDWQAVWRRMVDVNLVGAANVIHQVAAVMIEQGAGGRIVNIGSRGAFRGEPDHPAYGATKAGLHALSQSAAVSLAPHGIAVAAVAPGFVATGRTAGRLDGEEGERLRAQSPFGRVGTAEEIAAAVRYLASDEATWAAGTVLDLNGASHLR